MSQIGAQVHISPADSGMPQMVLPPVYHMPQQPPPPLQPQQHHHQQQPLMMDNVSSSHALWQQQQQPPQLLTRAPSEHIPPPANRRYRIKRQEPGCCHRCNTFYGGCCDQGGSCSGCNSCGCCDRPRVIYVKEEFENVSLASGHRKQGSGCC